MIRVEDIVEAIGKDLNTTLVLHKSVEIHPRFKVNKNSSTDNMAEAWDDCDK